jgi:hypothetical protein
MNKLQTTSVIKQPKATFLLLVLCVALLAIYSLAQLSVSQNASNPFIQDEEAIKDAQEIPRNYGKPLQKPQQKPSAKKTPKKTFTYWVIEPQTTSNAQVL